MSNENNVENKWGFAGVWNQSLLEQEERPLVARDYLWASELGKAPIDLWYRLKATKPTNPPNARSLRKFEAGNVFEWIVSLILKRAGILQESQTHMAYQYDGLMKVTGKSDFIAGGKVNVEKWEEEMMALDLPEVFLRTGKNIINHLSKNYPQGLESMPIEIKSVSSFMFEALERKQSSSKIHRMQLYHYMKAGDYKSGKLVYICRDDLRIMEFALLLNSPVEEEYKNAIENISGYFQRNEKPPLEKPVLFDNDIGKFSKNFNVAYSGYLKMLYGFETQKEFDDKYVSVVSRWNRVMKRIKDNAKMTVKNEEVKQEIIDAGFDLKEVVANLVSTNDEEEIE